MDPRIEQVLLAQAAQEAEQGPRLSDMVALGAGGGAAMGALTGAVPHMVGKGIGNMRGTNRAFRPGARMAGGLVGAILAVVLVLQLNNLCPRETGPAGAILAKIQSQGQMLPGDEVALENILREAYSQQGFTKLMQLDDLLKTKTRFHIGINAGFTNPCW